MPLGRPLLALATVSSFVAVACAAADDTAVPPPPVRLGYEAFRAWDRWAALEIGTRTVMRSTFDRDGGNDRSDACHFLRQTDADLVPLDLEGTGTLSFVRTNHWHGSPWRYDVDGVSTIVSESSTPTPDAPVPHSTFLPALAFPAPLAVTWSTTNGADLSWVPVPFVRSFELGYGRPHYGTGYYIARLVPEGSVDVLPAVAPWDPNVPPPADVLDLLTHAGEDQAPPSLPQVDTTVDLDTPGANAVLATLDRPGTIRSLELSAPAAAAVALGHATLRITWDDRAAPSVDGPVALFFGAGTFYRRDDREWLVRAFPVSVRFPPGEDRVHAAAFFPMPFRRGARLELVASEPVGKVDVHLRVDPDPPAEPFGHLHATYVDHASPTPGQDLVLLDTNGVEGEPAWCGSVVGTSVIFSDRAVLATLEGDPRFFFDDNATPQVQGTGTEEWGGGGDYWGGQLSTLPFAGHPTGAPDPKSMKTPEDGIESLYRYLLADRMPFGRRARVQLEHGGLDESEEHYRTLAIWYGAPHACLVPTDGVQLGDLADEARHALVAPDASAPYPVTSRFELGPDKTVDGKEIRPTTTDTARVLRGTAEVTLDVGASNAGVLLRRTLDYEVPEQRAEVYVADADDPASPFQRAGVWYVAGGTRHLFADGPKETSPIAPEVRVSSRRFRDDEFLIDRRLTQGRARLRVRFVVVPSGKPFRPGEAAPPAAFSAFRLEAYAWRNPLTF